MAPHLGQRVDSDGRGGQEERAAYVQGCKHSSRQAETSLETNTGTLWLYIATPTWFGFDQAQR